MPHRKGHPPVPGLVTLALGLATLFSASGLLGCGDDQAESFASARVVASRADLVGGNRALGDVGDFLLENDQIRVIVQGPGFSRGFGVYGGSLIDADLRRPTELGFETQLGGNDSFSELFPTFFLEAVATDRVTIISNGADGGVASIRAGGEPDDFLTLVGTINRAATSSHENFQDPDSDLLLAYDNTYELAPGNRYVTIRFRVQNESDETVTFPAEDAQFALDLLGLDLEGFRLPVGDVALFGDTSPTFVPGAGFDLRRALDRAYATDISLPAFPGVVTDWVASVGNVADVSYGYLAAASDDNFVWDKRDIYAADGTPITESSILVPFTSASLLGIFAAQAPTELGVGEAFETERYFIVGSGDVGSVLDVINEIQGVPVGRLGGAVRDALTGQPADEVSVLVYQRLDDGSRRIYSQYRVDDGGRFGGTLAPGAYSARVEGEGRLLSSYVDFSIAEGRRTGVELTANPYARISAMVVDGEGRLLPAKVTVVGSYGEDDAGRDPRDFLFNLEAGESFRWTDLVEDTSDPQTRRYVEAHAPTHDGTVALRVRPGAYEVYISRGPEYDVVRREVVAEAGRTVSLTARLDRVVDTRGWIAGDMHVHGQNSIDSGKPLDDLVRWAAAEGVEWLVGTDHNYLTNYQPVIDRNDLEEWVTSSIGIELTTLEAGHFNGYPLRYDTAQLTHGSFEWSGRPPQAIFDDLRALGSHGPDETIVQINHPRDTIQGYFESYRRHGLTAEFSEPGLFDSFVASSGPAFFDEDGFTVYSPDFDAIEVLTGKRFDFVHHYRVPEELPEGEIPDDVPPAGTILVDDDGEVVYSGALDDWYNLLNLGHRYIAVGNSDSHEDEEEIGYPRNMIHVGEDDPQRLDERAIIDALQAHRSYATTAPFVEFWVEDRNEGAMGSTIDLGPGDLGAGSEGGVDVGFRLTAAPWVSVSRVHIVRNGVIAEVVEIDPDRDLAANPVEETRSVPMATNDDGDVIDSWFVLEVVGERSLFPMALSVELPPLLLSDAVASLGGSFGFGASAEFGDLRPPQINPPIAYAITNPVWVTTDGEFTAPGVVPIAVRNADGQNPFDIIGGERIVSGEALDERLSDPTRASNVRWIGTATPVRERTIPPLARDPGNPYDVRRIFEHFGGHAH